MLDVYTWEPNANSGKPLLCLKEKGVPFTYHYIDMGQREQHSPAYLQINPKGTVPTLVHDGLVLTESSPALEYIDEAFDGPALMPSDPFWQWQMRKWIRYMDMIVCPALAMVGSNAVMADAPPPDAAAVKEIVDRIPTPERKRSWQLLMSRQIDGAELAESQRRIEEAIMLFEAHLTRHPWLAGDSYSLADINVLATLYSLPLSRPDAVGDEKTPHLMDWLRRCHDRKPIREAFAMGKGRFAERAREARAYLGLAE